MITISTSLELGHIPNLLNAYYPLFEYNQVSMIPNVPNNCRPHALPIQILLRIYMRQIKMLIILI